MNSLKFYRQNGFDNLRGNWLQAFLITLLSVVIGVYTVAPVPTLTVTFEELRNDPALLIQLTKIFRIDIVTFRLFLFFLLGAPGIIGLCQSYLALAGGEKLHVKMLFSRFPLLYKAVALRVIRTLITAVGLMLLVFPGIMIHYVFGMAPWLLAENPDLSIKEALNMSRDMTAGHKSELFMLDLSFIPVLCLALVTLGLGLLLYVPWHRSARALYYRDLAEQYRKN